MVYITYFTLKEKIIYAVTLHDYLSTTMFMFHGKALLLLQNVAGVLILLNMHELGCIQKLYHSSC